MVHFQIPVLVTVALIVIIIPSSTILISTNNYFGITTNFAYGQTNQINTNNVNPLNVQSIPTKKVHVGDIDIAYRTFGKGEPFLLIGGLGAKMDSWEPSILKNLSTNHTVIIFDNRGVGNTTTGTKPFSVQQFANDTNGLLDALKIQKADVLGHSMGSFVAQQLAVTHPEKVNRLVLVAASCGGKESIASPQSVQLGSEMLKNATNNVPISNVRTITSLNQGSAWMKSHPNFLQGVPEHLNFS
jgi:pimeloyl-ACP methyl ester carboxylesterase